MDRTVISDSYLAFRANALTDIVSARGKWWYVDTANTLDAGWETMAFECSKNGAVKNWNKPVRTAHYASREDTYRGHEEIIKNLKQMSDSENGGSTK